MEFSKAVQAKADAEAKEVTSDTLWAQFSEEYLNRTAPLEIIDAATNAREGLTTITATIRLRGVEQTITGEGNGAVSSFIDALAGIDIHVHVLDYAEHAMTSGGDARAAAYLECEIGENGDASVVWGVGIHSDITHASLSAVVSAVNRALA
jgi:2-isopropylmalate synthase